MAWCAARSFQMPAVDIGALRTRAPLAAVAGFASVAGSTFWRSLASSKPSSRFACSAISTDARIKEAVHTDKAPAALGVGTVFSGNQSRQLCSRVRLSWSDF
ncbi:hypothetical protein ACFX2K_007435 [Malus domestica]